MNSETDKAFAPGLIKEHVDIFLRRYTRETRPYIGFHCDKAAVTVNCACSDDDAHTGGRLVCVVDGMLQTIQRQEGAATVHPSSVLHAVTAMQSGTRYSLILFFHVVDPSETIRLT